MGSLYGFEVESEFPLLRLNSAPGARGSLKVAIADGPLASERGEPMSTLVAKDGRTYYASHEVGERCLLELPPTGEFLLDPGADRIEVEWHDGDPGLLEHRIASSAICTLLAMRGDLVLHAAAAQTDAGAVVFCGPTGRGKSTLGLTLGELGCPLLGEDGIAIALDRERRPTAFPGARGVRMRSRDADGARTDLVADPGPDEPAPMPVAAIVLLGMRGGALTVEPMQRAQALVLLTPHLIHSGGRAAIGLAFGRLARLLHDVPAYETRLPDDLALLSSSARRLLDNLRERG